MLQKSLLLVHYVSQSKPQIQRNCNEDVSLECPVAEKNHNFLSVTWYKLNNGVKHGIIRRGNGDKQVYYNSSWRVTFGEKQNLLMFKVSPEDSGRYECAISAAVGGQNQNHQVDLIVHECVTPAALTTMKNVLNTTQTSPLCQTHIQDLPVTWSIAGYVAVALAKIVLSLISIWVNILFYLSSRRQHTRWHS
uniref:Si:dkey-109a10.2 n=1 Tax=Amphilophus citrinellus TaxID=61819 RepID=A0A3Q0S2W0_AMPCI